MLKRDEVDLTDDKKLAEHFAIPDKQKEITEAEESHIELAINDYQRQKKKIMV